MEIERSHAPATEQKIKCSIKDFFSKYSQIHSFLQIWSHLLKKYVMENFIFRVERIASVVRLTFTDWRSAYTQPYKNYGIITERNLV